MDFGKIIAYIAAKAKEPSTWRGVAALAGAIGIGLAPDAWDKIGVAVAAVLGVIEMLRSETPKAP